MLLFSTGAQNPCARMEQLQNHKNCKPKATEPVQVLLVDSDKKIVVASPLSSDNKVEQRN
jgi:hypothetical protein